MFSLIFIILALVIGLCIGTIFPQPAFVAYLEVKFPKVFAKINELFGKKTVAPEPAPAPAPAAPVAASPVASSSVPAAEPLEPIPAPGIETKDKTGP